MVPAPTLTNICGIEGVLSSRGGDTSTGWPTGKGRGGEGSFTSTTRDDISVELILTSDIQENGVKDCRIQDAIASLVLGTKDSSLLVGVVIPVL